MNKLSFLKYVEKAKSNKMVFPDRRSGLAADDFDAALFARSASK